MNDNSKTATLPLGARSDLSLPDSEGYLGRRVEADGSWTMYHVFTGTPARVSDRIMVGLTKSEATATMVRRNADWTVR